VWGSLQAAVAAHTVIYGSDPQKALIENAPFSGNESPYSKKPDGLTHEKIFFSLSLPDEFKASVHVANARNP
jgi:hypothetical protein